MRLIQILCKQKYWHALTVCLFGHPGVYVLPGLLCSADKVQLFHLCLVEYAAGIFERLGETE